MIPATGPSVLVTGASGSLGRAISLRLARAGCSVIRQHHRHELRPDMLAAPFGARVDAAVPGPAAVAITSRLDLTDDVALMDMLARHRPRAVVHTAAATDVDWCEEHRDEARRINVEATGRLAGWAAANGAQFIYTSTDLVFDGLAAPYDETAAANPLSHYGRTKHDGESRVREAARGGGRVLVLRVALLYGRGSPQRGTFLDLLLARLARGEATTLFTDQFRTPVWLDDVARVVELGIARGTTGLLHVGGPRRMSRFEFGQAVAGVLGAPRELLRAGSFRDHGFRGDRPADVSLVSARVERELGVRFHPLAEALGAMAAAGEIAPRLPGTPPPAAAS